MRSQNGAGASDKVLAGFKVPAPPTDLKNDVLAAAHTAWQDDTQSSLWTRLWERRGLRMAWAGAVALLLVGHFLLPPGLSEQKVVAADSRPDVEIAEFLRPTRIVASATPNLGRFRPEVTEIPTFSLGGNES